MEALIGFENRQKRPAKTTGQVRSKVSLFLDALSLRAIKHFSTFLNIS